MRVVHLNQSDKSGGAAVAAYRLHLGLREKGLDSKLLVATAESPDATTAVAPAMTFADRLVLRLTRSLVPAHINILRGRRVLRHPFVRDADVINLHNLHTGLFFNYLSLPALGTEKPLVWTLHDMWAFTGHCSYSYDCNRWENGCGKCPYPHTYPAMTWDYSHWEWRLKRATYRRTGLTVVTPSNWLGRQVEKSILKENPLEVIPYGIDTQVYQPRESSEMRRRWGIREDALVVMFICDDLRDKRKGGDLLVEMVQSLREDVRKKLVLLIVGNGGTEMRAAFQCECVVTGYVKEEERKCELYACADVFICASRADNLPLVLQESIACGTPIVAFDVGGVADVVRHGQTGFLSAAEDAGDAAEHLLHLLTEEAMRLEMRRKCREVALAEYRAEVIADRYAAIYANVLERSRMRPGRAAAA